MNDIIITILTSSVVSTIFLAVSNIFIDQRKRSVEYITNERAKWRSDIREIANEIMETDGNNLYKPLTKLKVRINAYDRYLNKNRLQYDITIWECIENCEKYSTDLELLDIYKKNLIMHLSLMLKFDWERSKREVSINKNKIFKLLFLIIQIIIFIVVSLKSSRGVYYVIKILSLYTSINLLSYVLLQKYERMKNIHNILKKCRIYILTFLMLFFAVLIFGKIDIEINGMFLEGMAQTAFLILMLSPTEGVLVFNIMEEFFLEYSIQYFEVLAEQNEKVNEEVKMILDNRQKNKE